MSADILIIPVTTVTIVVAVLLVRFGRDIAGPLAMLLAFSMTTIVALTFLSEANVASGVVTPNQNAHIIGALVTLTLITSALAVYFAARWRLLEQRQVRLPRQEQSWKVLTE